MIKILNSEDDTAKFAESIYSRLKGGEIIGLIGPLGAGKTAFVRYLAQNAGVPAEQVSSPSFVLSYEYHGKDFTITHWDIYRLNEEPEELWEPPEKNEIRIIEWVDKSDSLLESADILIELDFVDLKSQPQARRVTIKERGIA